MASKDVLIKTIRNADGKPFQKYKGLEQFFELDSYSIIVDDVQNDPSGHSAMRVRVPLSRAGFPEDTVTASRSTALRDIIARRFWESTRIHAKSPIAGTTGGEISIPRPGQEILSRSSVVITQYFIEVRFRADLPSVNRCVASKAAEEMLLRRLLTIVEESMYFSAYKQSKLYNHLETAENADFIRRSLRDRGLVAFIASGSILPRADDGLAPMIGAIPFSCSDDLSVSFDVPNGPPLSGMGIREGDTAIAGADGEGKTTLLDSVSAGVMNHIPGDGREYAIARCDAVSIAREPGRPVDNVDVSAVVSPCRECPAPKGFTSEKASSPASEAASVSEALEVGSGFLILDEDTSCNSMIAKGDIVGEMGGSSPFLPISSHRMPASVLMATSISEALRSADHVIIMKGFTASSAKLSGPISPSGDLPASRCPVSNNIVFAKGRKEVHTAPAGIRSVEIGPDVVNTPNSALFDKCQTVALAYAVALAKDLMDGTMTMKEISEAVTSATSAESVKADSTVGPDLAEFRPMELAAVLNRHLQTLAIQK
jgi:predicted ABC-class ATPase